MENTISVGDLIAWLEEIGSGDVGFNRIGSTHICLVVIDEDAERYESDSIVEEG